MTECERLGIPYGVYTYSYAKNADDAVRGANHIIALLKGHNPTLPVYLDLEDESIKDTDHAAIAKAFAVRSLLLLRSWYLRERSWFKNILKRSSLAIAVGASGPLSTGTGSATTLLWAWARSILPSLIAGSILSTAAFRRKR